MTGVPGQALTLGGDGIQKLNLHTPMGPSTKKWNLEPTLPFLSYLRKNLDRRVPRRNLWTNSLGSRSSCSWRVYVAVLCNVLRAVSRGYGRWMLHLNVALLCNTRAKDYEGKAAQRHFLSFLRHPAQQIGTPVRPFAQWQWVYWPAKGWHPWSKKTCFLPSVQQIRCQFVRWHKTFVQNSGTGLGTPKSQRTRLLPNKNEFWECLRTSRTPMQNKLPILSGSWIPSKRHGTEQISWGSCKWISLMLLLDSESESFNQLFIFIFVSCFSKVERSSTKETQTLKKISTGPLVPVLLCEYEKNQSTCPIQKSFKRGKLELLGTCWVKVSAFPCLSMSYKSCIYAFSPCILCRPEFGQLRTVGADYQGQSSMSAATNSTGKCEGCNQKVSISTVSKFLQIKKWYSSIFNLHVSEIASSSPKKTYRKIMLAELRWCRGDFEYKSWDAGFPVFYKKMIILNITDLNWRWFWVDCE